MRGGQRRESVGRAAGAGSKGKEGRVTYEIVQRMGK